MSELRTLTAEDFAETDAASLAKVNPLEDGVFMRHQRRWLEDGSILKLCEKGRRTGITFAQAWEDTITAASARSAGGDNCYYIPDSKEKGLTYIGYVRHFAQCIGEELKALNEFLFEDRLDDGATRYITAWRARFASGFEVVALSSRPANIRGLQGHVTIDEAAFHRDVKEVLAAVMALLIWGSRICVISSHNGIGNAFNTLVNDARAGKSPFHLHTFTFDDAVRNGLYERVVLTGRKVAPKAEWYALIRGGYGSDKEAEHQELDCVPASGEGAWLTFENITACEHADSGKPELYQHGPCFGGEDIARRKNLWALYIFEMVGDVLVLRRKDVALNISFAEQDSRRDAAFKEFNIVRYAMDQTGMGEKPVEDAKKAHPGKIEGVILNGAARLNVATAAKMAFEDRKIRIDVDPEQRADLHKLKKVAGDTGAPRLVADNDESGHADRFWAVALACAAADMKTSGLMDFMKAQVAANPDAAKALERIKGDLAERRAANQSKPVEGAVQ